LLVFNESNGLITPSDSALWVSAMNQVLPDFYREWAVPLASYPGTPMAKALVLKAGTYAQYRTSSDFYIKDYIFIFGGTSDIASAAGYHWAYQNGQIFGIAFAATILGLSYGRAIKAVNQRDLVVGAVLAHEVFEALADPNGNRTADNRNGTTGLKALYDYENCDAVQGTQYNVSVSGRVVTLSDYVLPSWFVPVLPGGKVLPGPYNKVQTSSIPGQTITRPFYIAPGGYVQVLMKNASSETTVWGPTINRNNTVNLSIVTGKAPITSESIQDPLAQADDSIFAEKDLLRSFPQGAKVTAMRSTGSKRKYAIRDGHKTLGLSLADGPRLLGFTAPGDRCRIVPLPDRNRSTASINPCLVRQCILPGCVDRRDWIQGMVARAPTSMSRAMI
jgi:hypothetical protein